MCPLDETPLQLIPDDVDKLRRLIRKRVKSADDAAGVGLLGSSPQSWKIIVKGDEDHAETPISLLLHIGVEEVNKIVLHADLLGTRRDGSRVRPIEVPNFVRQILMAAVMKLLQTEMP
jgi:hypothetical protein